MIQKAKLINGQLEYFQQPNWLLGDATSYAVSQGYKDLIYQEGVLGIWEDENNIYVETPPHILTNEEISLQRQEAYKQRSDNYFISWQKDLAFGEAEKAEISRQKWLDECLAIENDYPYL